VQVVTFTFKERMLFDVQHDVEISGGPAVHAAFAESGEAYAGAVFNAGGNFCVDTFLAQHAAFTFALGAWIGDDLSCSLAGGASARDAEESLLIADLSLPVAGAAGDRSSAGSRA